MFVNRELSLQKLEEEYITDGFRFCVIYGRRRVGKTSLIQKFISDKPAIYFLSTTETEHFIIERFKQLIADFFQDDFLRELTISSIEQLFQYVANKDLPEKLVIVIDEFQYLTKYNPAVSSIFQRICDEILKNKNIFLILCGSIISMMYKETISYSSPLYGRRTSSIKLDSLDFKYISDFFPNCSENQLIEIYSVLYGIPKYLEMFKFKQNIYKAIEDNLLKKDSFMFNEPMFILQNELSETATYFTILDVIASGEHKIGNIAKKLNTKVQNITSFISKLIELELIYKEIPITEDNPTKSKKGLYFIKDNFFRFWFRYVLPNKSMLEIEKTDYALHKIKQSFSEFVSNTYERLCISWTMQNFNVLKCGRWWNNNEEIDVVGICDDYLIIGECKYSNKKVGIDVLKKLEDKGNLIKYKLPVKKYLLFSKSGFTEELINIAKSNKNIMLIKNLL